MSKPSEHTDRGLKTTDKILIFFFGIFLVLFAGNQYVYHLSGTKKAEATRNNILLPRTFVLYNLYCLRLLFFER